MGKQDRTRTHTTCPYYLPILLAHIACPCCLPILLAHTTCPYAHACHKRAVSVTVPHVCESIPTSYFPTQKKSRREKLRKLRVRNRNGTFCEGKKGLVATNPQGEACPLPIPAGSTGGGARQRKKQFSSPSLTAPKAPNRTATGSGEIS
jgi:hypothetical protein